MTLEPVTRIERCHIGNMDCDKCGDLNVPGIGVVILDLPGDGYVHRCLRCLPEFNLWIYNRSLLATLRERRDCGRV